MTETPLYLIKVMKKILLGAMLLGTLVAVSGCANGTVEDKRAPGVPGHKTFEIQVHRDAPLGPSEVWVRVSEKTWDRCKMDRPWPACAG